MSRRLDIEITSVNGGTATWRAAGARQPKGVLDVALTSSPVSVGGIFRAEIEQFMEGVEVLSLAPAKAASPLDPRNERIAILAPEPKGPEIKVSYAPKGRGRRDDTDRPRAPRRDRASGPSAERPTRPARTADGAGRAPRPGRDRSSSRRASISTETDAEKRTAARRGDRRSEGRSEGRGPRGASRPGSYAAPPVTTTFRNAFLATLSPEQLPVAEQLLRGGMPAVRQAVAEQNKNATAQGRPTISAEVIDRIAEELLGRSTLAYWKDRAAGAAGLGKELRLRDLRAVVTSAKTVTLDDEARAQLKELQASLTTRVDALRVEWTAKLEKALDSGDVIEALKLTARTPEPSTRVSAEAAAKIVAMASAALTSTTDPTQWQRIIFAAVESPVRRLIKPEGIPNDEACRQLATTNAGSIPELAKLLGMRVPPPPTPTKPARPVRRSATSRGSSSGAGS